ncbi:MAG TPA: winged helix DNA-binding domain-containing protein [Streptosporangiaceae bacterium]|nr:winged helix DNA-binding domain-containing protein [Streptosporangiaceae bacterium]
MRSIGVAERRARLGLRHRLAISARADDPVDVARSLVAVHSTDPTSVYLGTLARMQAGGIETVERALYDDRMLIRLLGMRRTVFVTARETAPVIQAACSAAVAARERRKLLAMLADAGVAGDADPWLAEVEEAALRALEARGEATAAELATGDERLQIQLVLAKGRPYEGRQNLGSRVLHLLAAQGLVVRGRPRGSWTSHQHRWSPLATWCPEAVTEWKPEQAEEELARHWLTAYGPAPADDLRWWAGWTKTQTGQVLARIGAADVDLDGAPGLVLAGDVEPPAAVDPWAALLPGLDSTPMGWQHRDWFLGHHATRLFDRTGNIGPTVWWQGRIVGGWAQDSTGEIIYRLLEDVGSEAAQAIEAAAARLAAIVGGARLSVRGRGPTWLEQELSG